MKILLITDGITPFVVGGMQKHSANLAKQLTLIGTEVTLVYCVSHDDKIPSDDEVNATLFSGNQKLHKIVGLKFPQIGKMPGHYLKESFGYSILIYEQVKGELGTYDFIYAKGFAAWKLLAEKEKGLSCPPIGVNFHGFEMFQNPPSFKARLEQLILKDPVKWNCAKADFVFSYGGKITRIVINKVAIESEKIIEIPSGVDQEWVNEDVKPKANPIKFLFVGRYERRKGIEELNKVLKEIIGKADFEFNFIGPIPNNKKISSKKIHYHGSVADQKQVREIMQICDVLVCPSHSEGMPNVILEAMASGLAIIATNVGAISEMVDPENGWLIEPASRDDLKLAINNAIESIPEHLKNKKEKSVNRIKERFLWNKIGTQTVNAILNIVMGKIPHD